MLLVELGLEEVVSTIRRACREAGKAGAARMGWERRATKGGVSLQEGSNGAWICEEVEGY